MADSELVLVLANDGAEHAGAQGIVRSAMELDLLAMNTEEF